MSQDKTYEHQRAVMEGQCNRSLEIFQKHLSRAATPSEVKIEDAAFERGFREGWAAAHLERTGQSVTNDARIDAARLDGLKAGWNFAIAGQDAKYDAAVLALGNSVTTLRKEARATPPEAATAEAAEKAPASVPSDIVYRWAALDYSGYCYSSNPPEDLPQRCNLTAFYRQPDALREALHEISATGNLTATPTQFVKHLQGVARAALAAQPRSTK